MNTKKPAIIHLLIPKEFKVWCKNHKPSVEMTFTNLPSKATCANCLTKMRTKITGKYKKFKVLHTVGGDDLRWVKNLELAENQD